MDQFDDALRALPGQLALGIRNRKREALVASLREKREFFAMRVTECDHALYLLDGRPSEDPDLGD